MIQLRFILETWRLFLLLYDIYIANSLLFFLIFFLAFTYTNHSRLTVLVSGLFAKYYAEFD